MFKALLNQSLTIIRTESIDTLNHIVEQQETTYGPYPCRTGRPISKFVQAVPQTKITQNLKMYTIINANIQVGDIALIDGNNYIVKNIYKPAGHHIECDLILHQEA
ncbi:hypothetical protein JMF89_05595 [Clostridiaceae bacterium UIB06]|uniref:Phage protein n=1 Tax=Clostridium thailandense TaxID=2794346 RepID=A0A949TN45_9CLOT|nr:hypothetical protein [Clostridium thailandense]MBV7275445.1 hypothetical protein [Clostridium thailandense]MCH5136694.1 hypothetical protein [Clostridiaceae bacterium UIB06]